MRVAVSGATGFIGKALSRALLERGDEVTALCPEGGRSPPPARGLSVARFRPGPWLEPSVLAGAEAVVHLAGEPLAGRWTTERRDRVMKSRREGTAALARASATSGSVRTFVSASAVGYYGDRGSEPLTEESSRGVGFLADVCREWESAAATASESGIRTVYLRTGLVLHPSGGALASMLPPFRLGLGGPMGSGRQYVSWVHREDIVRLYLWALDQPSLTGAVNGTAPHPVTNREFATELGRALGRPALLPLPSFALKLALGELSSVLLGGQRVLPARALASGFTFQYPVLGPALTHLLQEQVNPAS